MSNSGDILIRLALDADFEQIFQIWLDGIENSFNRSLIEEGILREKFTVNFNNRAGIFNFWVAVRDSNILGWQSLIRTSNNPFRENLQAESSTYISKNSRFKGLGETLIAHVLKEAENSQLEYVIGYVTASNVAARKITQATGWVEVGEMPAPLKGDHLHKKLYLVRPV